MTMYCVVIYVLTSVMGYRAIVELIAICTRSCSDDTNVSAVCLLCWSML